MIAKVLEYLKGQLTSMAFFIALFFVIWLIAWTLNATAGTHFDLLALKDLANYILGKYGIDSLLNTKFGGTT